MCDEFISEHILIQTISFTYTAAVSHSASSVYKWQPAGHKVHFFTSFCGRGREYRAARWRHLPSTSQRYTPMLKN